MPFWWRRRRKPWFGRWRYNRRFQRHKRRVPRRRFTRRRNRRAPRRRRRRRYKVRRKKRKITIQQWQPESIKKCKIKGQGTIVLGAEGTQYRCYTTVKNEWTNPKVAGGGGFGVELFTLKYLYREYKAKHNIWTATNEYKDLCRYTGCKFIFYRHPETDFILSYDIQPPFTISKYTYMFHHPILALQRRHKKLLLSTATKPTGRLTKKFKIRPPKQLITKWFFQEDFADYGLVSISATACNFRYPWLGVSNENLIITLYYLQPEFYPHSDWAQYHATAWNPLGVGSATKTPETLYYYYYNDKNVLTQWQMQEFKGTQPYYSSLSIDKGWFCPQVLRAVQVKPSPSTHSQSITPCGVLRYNPAEDTGKGNKIWVTDILASSYAEPKDEDLIMQDYPLYMMFYGYTSYLQQVKHDSVSFKGKMFVVQSNALKRVRGESTKNFYPLIDKSFCYGKGPNMTDPILFTGNTWYPSIYAQRDSINAIVNCGPLTPKYNETKNSTWQCNYFYDFYFKWGGAYPPDQEVEDPATKGKYPVPDHISQNVQIADPQKQRYSKIFKSWDYRRGALTNKAIKRMQENLSTDESCSTDSTTCSSAKRRRVLPTLQDPKKENKKIQKCLLSLCEEPTWQEQEKTPDLIQLIHQQHEQQQLLKHNLLTLIADLKSKQRNLLHQTGFLG
nr:MAG: ORF1 [Torque teno midi virus]